MSGPQPTNAALLFLIIFSIVSFKLSYCIGNNSIIFCPDIEKQALLSFKQSLEDPCNRLSSWINNGEVSCCDWKGVVCNNLTGHVHQLRLQSYDWFSDLRGKINPSLLNLKHLRYLDLSQNSFEGTIPSFIGLFASLEYLNLSYAGFQGTIPHTIGNLSNLHTLGLGFSWRLSFNIGSLEVDSLEWLSGLSQLEHLNMNYVNLSKASGNWVQVINALPSLVELRFQSCSLNFIAPLDDVNVSSLAILDLSSNKFQSFAIPRWIFQLNKLIFLDLSQNSFEGPIPSSSNITKLQYIDLSCNKFQSFAIPRWIFQLNKLIFLDLCQNYFEGPIPSISNTTKLQYIDLSDNFFNSTIPDWLYFCKDLEFVFLRYSFLNGTISNAIANLSSLNTLDLSGNELSGKIPREIANLCKMRELDLSENKLQGEISDSFGNISDCFLGALKSLSLRENQLSGHLTDQFGEFKSLEALDLGKNLISGAIPTNLGMLLSLKDLRLDDNKLTGNLPKSLGKLCKLGMIFIGGNMLEGVVNESYFANLTKLSYLSASGNHLTLKVNPNWIPPFQLDTIALGSWNLGVDPPIPSWLETQKNIMELDLSSTGISGHVPNWIWEMRFLNLSHNHLHGNIPDINGPEDGPRLVYLSSNQFSGSLPRVANRVTELDLSNNSFSGGISHFLCDMTNETYRLEILHLGGNKLTGELPDCWMKWPSLTVLNLGNNNLFGSIPNSIGFLADLLSLNLYGNKFSGEIPFSMHNCTKLLKIDLADNDLGRNLPTWIGTSLGNLKILILRSNKFSGEISSTLCHLNSLQILDLSGNGFSGIIPRCVGNFTAMATKRSLAEYGSEEMDYSYYIGVFRENVIISTKGEELQYDTTLSLVTNIDLSRNNLSGDIPKELTSLVELRSLNLSRNHLTGLIPDGIGKMKQLESLDFSRNSLSGEIPNSFRDMPSLNHLSLSYNNLIGRIPESTQLLGFDASSFIGNKLCGPPLSSNCSNKVPGTMNKEGNEGNKSEIGWFYIFLSLGYGAGFSAVCTTLVFKKSWRKAYFGFLEDMWNKLYVFSHIKLKRLTKRM